MVNIQFNNFNGIDTRFTVRIFSQGVGVWLFKMAMMISSFRKILRALTFP